MVIERIIFNILAFLFFIFMFLKMIQKNDTNYLAILTVQALGITLSFFELMHGILQWSSIKLISYLLSVLLPIVIFYLDNHNINLMEIGAIGLAKAMELCKNRQKAKKILTEFIQKYPGSYYGHKMLAHLYETEGGMRKAIDEYVKAIDICRNDCDSYYKISELLNQLDKKEEAITMLQNLLKIKPDYSKASILLGKLMLEKSMYKDALMIYKTALLYRPNDYEIYYTMGIAYTQLNDFKNAKNSYEKAAQINHLQYKAKYYLGKIAIIYNDLSLAEHYFMESMYGEEVEAQSYYQLAKIAAIKSDKEKAIVFLNKALELDENLIPRCKQEPVFVPIQAYLSYGPHKIQNKPEEPLDQIEKKVMEHLEDTAEVVENLSDLEYKTRMKEQKKNPMHEKNQER